MLKVKDKTQLPKGIAIVSAIVTYSQDSDSNEEDVGQELTIEQTDAGGGKYFVLSTRRWAFDKIQELLDVVNDFQNRFPNKGEK